MKIEKYAPMDKNSVLSMQCAIFRVISKDFLGTFHSTHSIPVVSNQSEIDTIVANKNDLITNQAEEFLFWQVLGSMVMRGKGPLDSIRKEVLLSIDKDHWENENDDHWLTLRNFEAEIIAY